MKKSQIKNWKIKKDFQQLQLPKEWNQMKFRFIFILFLYLEARAQVYTI